MFDISTKDVILVIVGFALSVVASAVWDWWKTRSTVSLAASRAFETKLKARLNSEDLQTSAAAFQECLMKFLFWFTIANIMIVLASVGASGFYIFQIGTGIAVVLFFISIIFFAMSMKWIRLYLRHKHCP